jgi:hypothetical protein
MEIGVPLSLEPNAELSITFRCYWEPRTIKFRVINPRGGLREREESDRVGKLLRA